MAEAIKIGDQQGRCRTKDRARISRGSCLLVGKYGRGTEDRGLGVLLLQVNMAEELKIG